MKKLVIKLQPGIHYRNTEGKEKIRQSLVEQGYEVKSEFDQSLSVYEKASRMTRDVLFMFLLYLLVISYIVLLELILRGKI